MFNCGFKAVPSLGFIVVGSLVQNGCYLEKFRERLVNRARDAAYGTFPVGRHQANRAWAAHAVSETSLKCRNANIWGTYTVNMHRLGFSSCLSWLRASCLAPPIAVGWKNPTSDLVLFSPRRFLFRDDQTTETDERVQAVRWLREACRERKQSGLGAWYR